MIFELNLSSDNSKYNLYDSFIKDEGTVVSGVHRLNYMARINDFVKFRWAKGEELDPEIEKMFWDNLGQTPMCCFFIHRKWGEEDLISCDQLKKALSKKDFEKFCLHCQVKIAVILVRKQTEGKKIKDYTKDDKRKLNKTAKLIMIGNNC